VLREDKKERKSFKRDSGRKFFGKKDLKDLSSNKRRFFSDNFVNKDIKEKRKPLEDVIKEEFLKLESRLVELIESINKSKE